MFNGDYGLYQYGELEHCFWIDMLNVVQKCNFIGDVNLVNHCQCLWQMLSVFLIMDAYTGTVVQ